MIKSDFLEYFQGLLKIFKLNSGLQVNTESFFLLKLLLVSIILTSQQFLPIA